MICDGADGQCLCLGIGSEPAWQCLNGTAGDGGFDFGDGGTFGGFGEGGSFGDFAEGGSFGSF
jgi:hypothetical protein